MNSCFVHCSKKLLLLLIKTSALLTWTDDQWSGPMTRFHLSKLLHVHAKALRLGLTSVGIIDIFTSLKWNYENFSVSDAAGILSWNLGNEWKFNGVARGILQSWRTLPNTGNSFCRHVASDLTSYYQLPMYFTIRDFTSSWHLCPATYRLIVEPHIHHYLLLPPK